MQLLKKILKVTGIAIAGLIALLLCIVGYITFFLPNVGNPPDLHIAQTSQRIAHGAYLANHVMACMSCHSSRSWDHPGAPMIPGTMGKGGDKFTQDTLGFFGDLYFPNITPAALGSWTDGEIFHAITSGVGKDGRALTPIMPYKEYGKADVEDIKDVIAYLRSIPPVPNTIPTVNNIPFFIQVLNNLAPSKPEFHPKPDRRDTAAYGQYLTQVAGCIDCHSPFNGPFGVDKTQAFSGGPEFTMPGAHVRPINLTPDKQTGIGLWSRADFLGKFHRYRDSAVIGQTINPKSDFTSLMPWAFFAGMKDEDLSAIYTYLKTLQPVHNPVEHVVTTAELQRRKKK